MNFTCKYTAIACLALCLAANTGTANAADNNQERFQKEYASIPLDPRHNGKILRERLDNWRTKAHKQMPALENSNVRIIADLRTKIQNIDFRDNPKKALSALNALINNSVNYKSDYSLYNKEDHWSSPISTILDGGDCEDIALLKATALYMLGVPKENLHLAVGEVEHDGVVVAHAILAVKVKNDFVLLNNISNNIENFTSDTFTPVYSIGTSEIKYYIQK